MRRHFKSPVTGLVRWLLVMAVVVGLSACSSDDSKPVARDACGTKVGTIESPSRLTYRAAGAGDVVEDVGVLCKRVRAAKLEAKVLGAGRDRIVLEVRKKDVRAAEAVAKTGALGFYDWEANVIGPSGKPAPTDVKVTGGPAAGQTGLLDFYEAVARAAKRPANVEENNGRTGSRFYAVDPKGGKVFGSGAATRAVARTAVPAAERLDAKVLEVKPGTVVLRSEDAPDIDAPEGRSFFVLRDDVALRGSEIRNPQQNFDKGPGASGEPTVTFEFTPAGKKAFKELTRTLADRGSRSVGVAPGQSAAEANQHFAIVVDDRIVSTPYIDFRQNPEGVDGSTGSQIQGGFTIASARQLASVLSSGALPVPLELIANTAP